MNSGADLVEVAPAYDTNGIPLSRFNDEKVDDGI
jgi:hypothetical protein